MFHVAEFDRVTCFCLFCCLCLTRKSFAALLCLHCRKALPEKLCFCVVCLSTRVYVHASMFCFRDISGMHLWFFTKLSSLVRLATKMNCLGFAVKVAA